MASTVPIDNALEVTDSTDWLGTPLCSLSTIEAALRCQICKEFFTAPLITSCEHTFCSLCIRRCLTQDGKCPVCRKNDDAIRLRHSKTLDDLVTAFKQARPELFAFATKPVAYGEASFQEDSGNITPQGEGGDEPPRKRARTSRQTRSTQNTYVIEDSDKEDEDFIPEGFVKCPICNRKVKVATINLHIDRNCLDEPSASRKNTRPSIPSAAKAIQNTDKSPERLAQVNYGMMKEKQIRQKLVDFGLFMGGTRPIMEKRITEWITLWNANCDASRPRSRNELKREMDVWERTQGVHASTSSTGAHIKSKGFDASAWSTQHDSTFKDLIATARKKAQVIKPNPELTQKSLSSPSILTPHSASQPQNSVADLTNSTVVQEDRYNSPSEIHGNAPNASSQSPSTNSPVADHLCQEHSADLPGWVTDGLQMLRQVYSNDRFEGIMKHSLINTATYLPVHAPPAGESIPEGMKWMYICRIRCSDCPGKLYNPGPGLTVENFEVHLQNRQHRQRIEMRMNEERAGLTYNQLPPSTYSSLQSNLDHFSSQHQRVTRQSTKGAPLNSSYPPSQKQTNNFPQYSSSQGQASAYYPIQSPANVNWVAALSQDSQRGTSLQTSSYPPPQGIYQQNPAPPHFTNDAYHQHSSAPPHECTNDTTVIGNEAESGSVSGLDKSTMPNLQS